MMSDNRPLWKINYALTMEIERLRAVIAELTSHDYVHGNAAFRNACRARAKAALADQGKGE